MARKTRNVELVIRGKNEASKPINEVSTGLKDLGRAQADTAKSAERTGEALAKFGAEARALRDNLESLKKIDQAQGQIDRLATSLGKAQKELADLNQRSADVATEQQRLVQAANQARQALQDQSAVTANTAAELKKVDTELTRASNRYKYLYTELKKAKAPSDELRDALRKQRDVVVALTFAQEKAQKQLAKETTAEQQLGAALAQVTNDLKNSERNQEDLASSIAKTNTQIEQQIAKMRELQASTSRKTSGPVEAPMSAMTDYGKQVKAVADAQRVYGQARAEVAKLKKEMTSSVAPSTELARALELAQVKADNARLALQREGIALANVRLQTLETAKVKKAAAAAAQQEAQAAREAQMLAAANSAAAAATAAAKEREIAAQEKLNAAYKQTADSARRALDLQQRIRGQVLSMIAAYAGLPAIVNQLKSVVDAYQKLEAVQNRLGSFFDGDTEKVAQEIDWLRRNADRLKTSFQTLSDEYSKFVVATKNTVLEGKEARRVFLSLAEAGRVNKLTTDQMGRTYKAITQMVSKGKIQAEELRQQLGDALPGAMQILAAGMGKTTAELDKMMEAGAVGIDNLSSFATELEKRFGKQLAKSLDSVTSSIADFGNASEQAKLKFAQGGFIDALQNALDRLTEYLRSAEAATLINNLSKATGGLITVLSNLPQYFRPLMVFASAFVGLKLAMAFINLRNSMVAARVAMTAGAAGMAQITAAANGSRIAVLAAAAATRSWSVLMSAAGGPAGIAIGVVTTLLGVWLTRTDSATEAMTKHRDIVDKVKNAYDKVDKSSKNWAKNINEVKAGEAEKNLKEVSAIYDELVGEMDKTSASFRNMLNMPSVSTSPIAQENRKHVTELTQALDALKARSITLDEFRDRVNAVERATKTKAIKEWAVQLLELAGNAKSAEKDVREAELVLKALTGTADEAEGALRELNGEVEDSASAFDGAIDKVKAYEKALNDLKKFIPSLKFEADKIEDLESLNKQLEVLMADGPPDPQTARLIEQAIRAINQKYTDQMIAKLPGMSTGYYNRLVQNESGGDTRARAKTSSATGVAQFTEGTWLSYFDRVFPELASFTKEAKLAMRTNAEASMKVLEVFTADNIAALASKGIAVNDTTAYLAHFLGAGDAVKVLLANPDELATSLVKKESIAANPGVFKKGMTAGDLIAWSARKMGASGGRGGLSTLKPVDLLSSGRTQAETDAAEAEKKRKQELEEQIKKRQKVIEQLDAEIAGLGQTATQQEIINTLTQLGLDINSREGQLVAEKIRKKNEERDLQKEISDLQALQASLQQQITYAQNQGDNGAVAALKGQLTEVNAQLVAAIEKAIAFWEAMGGSVANAAIVKLKDQLRNVVAQTDNLNTKFLMTGQQINESLASGGANAFAEFAEAVANGENALDSLGNAFRKMAADFLLQIGKMILQQAIFNALQNSSWGGAIAGAVGKMFHTGGVVGVGGQNRLVNPAWFAGAARYHTGGIAGLKPGEVPAILEKGETIRTEEQEAALQQRMAGGGSGTPNIKIVNALDSGEFVSQGVESEIGQKAILNFIRANRSAVKSALG